MSQSASVLASSLLPAVAHERDVSCNTVLTHAQTHAHTVHSHAYTTQFKPQGMGPTVPNPPNPTSALPYLLHQSKQNVCVYSPFMGLVQHDDGVLGEVIVHQALPQQHPICHVLDDGLRAGAVLEANGVANLRRGEGEGRREKIEEQQIEGCRQEEELRQKSRGRNTIE